MADVENDDIQSEPHPKYRNDFIAVYDFESVSYEHFVRNHLLQNTPCLVTRITTKWSIREQWIDDKTNTIDYQCICDKYGEEEVDVASCGQRSYSDQKRSRMKLKEYIESLQSISFDDNKIDTESDDAMNGDSDSNELDQWLSDVSEYKLSAFNPSWTESILYCKDWHIARIGDFYPTPHLFADDWLNRYWDQSKASNDYKFCYLGPRGSWTPFR